MKTVAVLWPSVMPSRFKIKTATADPPTTLGVRADANSQSMMFSNARRQPNTFMDRMRNRMMYPKSLKTMQPNMHSKAHVARLLQVKVCKSCQEVVWAPVAGSKTSWFKPSQNKAQAAPIPIKTGRIHFRQWKNWAIDWTDAMCCN